MFVAVWDDNWGDVLEIVPFDSWLKRPIGTRSWFTETIWARDELAAYMKTKEQTNDRP